MAGSAGSAVRFPVRAGREDPDSGVGQVGAGDSCSCLELWRQTPCALCLASPPQPGSGSSREGTAGQETDPRLPGEGGNQHQGKAWQTPHRTEARPYRSFLSISRSSCRLLHPAAGPWPQGLESSPEGWALGTQLIGGEVKQVLGLESDRSWLTGVGLILREGFVLLGAAAGFPPGPTCSALTAAGGPSSLR